MIGVEEAKLEQVLDLLKETAGRRTVTLYQNPGSMPPRTGLPPLFASTPMEVCQGGVASSCWTWNVWKNIDLFILKLKIHTTQGKDHILWSFSLSIYQPPAAGSSRRKESGGSPSPVSRLT